MQANIHVLGAFIMQVRSWEARLPGLLTEVARMQTDARTRLEHEVSSPYGPRLSIDL
jgi:hypothetical protein